MILEEISFFCCCGGFGTLWVGAPCTGFQKEVNLDLGPLNLKISIIRGRQHLGDRDRGGSNLRKLEGGVKIFEFSGPPKIDPFLQRFYRKSPI